METHLWQAAGCCHPSVSSNGWEIGKSENRKNLQPGRWSSCVRQRPHGNRNPRKNYGPGRGLVKRLNQLLPLHRENSDIFRLLCGNLCHWLSFGWALLLIAPGGDENAQKKKAEQVQLLFDPVLQKS